MDDHDELVLAVEQLVVVQDRFDVQHSDPTGTSAGDDGDNADNKLNLPE
ncbi:MAG: hypothetical protein ACRDRX_15055 [Pseudonocardiaceae bacterium]